MLFSSGHCSDLELLPMYLTHLLSGFYFISFAYDQRGSSLKTFPLVAALLESVY